MNDGSPLCEASTHGLVLRETIAKAVKTFGDELGGSSSKGLRATIDLDPGKDASVRKKFGESYSIRTTLTDSLVVQNHTTDELGNVWGANEHFPVGAPALLGRLDPQRIKSPGQGGNGFVSR